jgi:hypothetical protein
MVLRVPETERSRRHSDQIGLAGTIMMLSSKRRQQDAKGKSLRLEAVGFAAANHLVDASTVECQVQRNNQVSVR